ncbi:MAG: hypothetical protein ACXQTR_00370 [Candidatus Methanospirareceae archaeon]
MLLQVFWSLYSSSEQATKSEDNELTDSTFYVVGQYRTDGEGDINMNRRSNVIYSGGICIAER